VSSLILEGKRSVFIGSEAWLVEDSRELAWAENHVITNPMIKYILGRYVEADNANSNGHIFKLKQLETAQKTIPNSPLNLLHRPHYIVGNYIAAELCYPTGETADGEPGNPYIEALASFYRYYFPDEFATVEKAHNDGVLYFSMECVPKTVACAGVCHQEYAYDGRQSPTYCEHLNVAGAQKLLGEPHFTGGALIIPPVKPGWNRADITQVSSLMTDYAQEAEMAYDSVRRTLPHLDALKWESMVVELMRMAYAEAEGEYAKNYSTQQRKAMAKTGVALPDGSYPIADAEDLAHAIQAFGRSSPGDRAAVKSHIQKRATALGKTNLIPDNWNN